MQSREKISVRDFECEGNKLDPKSDKSEKLRDSVRFTVCQKLYGIIDKMLNFSMNMQPNVKKKDSFGILR